MVNLKGLNNNIGLGRLITLRPLFCLPGFAWVFTLSFALTGVNVKMVLCICIYFAFLRQKVSSSESTKICLRQNFSFYSS